MAPTLQVRCPTELVSGDSQGREDHRMQEIIK
jgi:hypothetical protein